MKKLTSLGLCALAAPALALGIGSVLAQEQGTTPSERAQEQSTTTDRTLQVQPTVTQRAQEQRATTEQAAQDQRAAAERAQSQHTAQSAQMSTQPANTLLAHELIGSTLKSGTDEDLGSISDFIVDEDGQIVAVIVGVGGFLGVGERDVAIAWDSVERTMNEDGDGYVFHANMTDLALRDTPAYN